MRTLLALILLLCAAVPAAAVEPGERLSDPAQEARAREISRELRCLVCQNQSIDDSNAPLARDLRRLVVRGLEGGGRGHLGSAFSAIEVLRVLYDEVLRHDPLAVALVILHIEWMTQRHYVDSVRDDGDLDPLFKSLLKHHWMEEAQHARLDQMMVYALAENRDEAAIQSAIEEYLEIGMFLDEGLKSQTGFNLDAFEQATGRTFAPEERAELFEQQHQALRWTYLGSGMTHPKFVATLGAISPAAERRIAEVAPVFC